MGSTTTNLEQLAFPIASDEGSLRDGGTQVNPWTPTSAFMSQGLGPKPVLYPWSYDLEVEDFTVELSGPATLTNVQSMYLCLCIAVVVVEKKRKNWTTVGFELGTSISRDDNPTTLPPSYPTLKNTYYSVFK